MASMRELSEQIVNQTLTNKAAENYRMTPYGAIARPSEIVEDEDSIFRKPLETEGRFNILPLRDMPNGEREFALPLPLAELANAFTAPGRALTQPDFDVEQEALDAGLALMGGPH